MADYQEAPLATRPKTLDPNEYFNLSPELRRVEEERAALRANLKRQYLTQLNNPHRKELIVSARQQCHLLKWLKLLAGMLTVACHGTKKSQQHIFSKY